MKRIVWNIRHSNLDSKLNKVSTLRINKICSIFSKSVAVIAYNGQAARRAHEEMGYCRQNGIVLDNGCDCGQYAPDANARAEMVTELRALEKKYIMLSVTKNHPIKDNATFIGAFAMLKARLPDAIAVMCGNGITKENCQLVAQAQAAGLCIGEDILLLGMRHDVARLMAGSDLYVLHSAGEAFPNTLLQAMACGCLCITTDVGDAARIIGDDAFVVAPGNADALCEKMLAMYSLIPADLVAAKASNRDRVLSQFSIEQIVKTYEELY